MASLKDMRVRLASTKATQKITKAMQMVASAKMRKAQLAALAGRPYAQLMNEVLAAATAGAGASSIRADRRKDCSMMSVSRCFMAHSGETDRPGGRITRL